MIYQNNPYTFQQPQQQPQQIQMSGFVTVQSEDEARKWGIAPGNSITFRDENAPFIYTKTMGFSQLDIPIFEKYRLVKVEDPKPEPTKDVEIEDIKKEIEELRAEIAAMKEEEK